MKVGLLYELDGLANSLRAYEIRDFVANNGYEVALIDLNKEKFESKYFYRKAKLHNFFSGKGWNYNYITENIKLRAEILRKKIINFNFDAVICGSARNAYVLTKDLNCIKIFDCPTPWTAELKQYPNESLLTKEDVEKLAELELEIYRKSNYVVFHWQTYTDYAKENIYSGDSLITLRNGCHPKKVRAKFQTSSRIVFFGNIGNNYIDINLLKRLIKESGRIDVYGLPEPKKKQELNYKGYAKSDVLVNYQFGLITIDKNDKLHCNGFSAKYLDYISYGLPVLEPEWRHVPGLTEHSILYNEDNFLEQINKYSDKNLWQKKSDEVYELAKTLDWNTTLKPLLKIFN